jgi:hypothetical protein
MIFCKGSALTNQLYNQLGVIFSVGEYAGNPKGAPYKLIFVCLIKSVVKMTKPVEEREDTLAGNGGLGFKDLVLAQPEEEHGWPGGLVWVEGLVWVHEQLGDEGLNELVLQQGLEGLVQAIWVAWAVPEDQEDQVEPEDQEEHDDQAYEKFLEAEEYRKFWEPYHLYHAEWDQERLEQEAETQRLESERLAWEQEAENQRLAWEQRESEWVGMFSYKPWCVRESEEEVQNQEEETVLEQAY